MSERQRVNGAKTARLAMVAMAMAAAAGCTRPAPTSDGQLPWLDGAVRVTAQGTQPRSEVSLQRSGALDPGSSSMEVMVNDAAFSLHVRDHKASIDVVRLVLDDVDLPPSADLPDGLQLRKISLGLDQPTLATVEQAEADTLVLRANTSVTLRSSMVLSDGTLYQLGDQETEPTDVNLRVTTDGQAATVTLDAAPPQTCWSVAGIGNSAGMMLLQAQNCAVFVESSAQVYSL